MSKNDIFYPEIGLLDIKSDEWTLITEYVVSVVYGLDMKSNVLSKWYFYHPMHKPI